MPEKPTTRLRRLERQERDATKALDKLMADRRKVEDDYRVGHAKFMQQENELRERIDAVSAQLPEARRAVQEAEADG